MPLSKHIIMGVHVNDRAHHVQGVQELFTEFGCNIKTRVGFHDTGEGFCSPNGLIVLEMIDDEAAADELAAKLNAIEGVETQKMVFDHP